MPLRSCLFFLKKLLTKQNSSFHKGVVTLVLLLILNTGCSQLSGTVQQLPNLLPGFSAEANFQLRVAPSGRLGVYTVTGSTNLPDQSQITVAAVRYLRPANPLAQNVSPNPTFSILAYQDVEVDKGKWQTTLNIWKVAPNGQFQEPWQLEQSKLGLKLTPDPEITFLATVSPTDSLSELESQLKKQGIKVASSLVRNTPEGEQYVQATQALPVALPTGQTTPPAQLAEDINGGWGNRFLLIPEPPNPNNLEKPSKRRTDAPLSPAEFMQ